MMYRVSELPVDRVQFLAVWTGWRVKLHQYVFSWIINDVVKGLSNHHLQDRSKKRSEVTWGEVKVENAQKVSQSVLP